MEKNTETIVKNAIIADAVIQGSKVRETEEQRRITALEQRLDVLEDEIQAKNLAETTEQMRVRAAISKAAKDGIGNLFPQKS